jgi:hypothetical protein
MQLHNEKTYRAGFLGELKNVIPFGILDDKHPEAEDVRLQETICK